MIKFEMSPNLNFILEVQKEIQRLGEQKSLDKEFRCEISHHNPVLDDEPGIFIASKEWWTTGKRDLAVLLTLVQIGDSLGYAVTSGSTDSFDRDTWTSRGTVNYQVFSTVEEAAQSALDWLMGKYH